MPPQPCPAQALVGLIRIAAAFGTSSTKLFVVYHLFDI
jgi:hypothetical protein